MSTNYLTLTNNAILESGADTATFASNGSDWSTSTDNLRNQFKTWIARAWKEIQQDLYDPSFLEEIAVVNIDPGVEFYTDGTPVSVFSELSGSTTDIYDEDDTVAIEDVPFLGIRDLTLEDSDKPYGYFDVTTTASTPISWALKPGAEYFKIESSSITVGFTIVAHFISVGNDYVNNSATYLPSDGSLVRAVLNVNGHSYDIAINVTNFDPSGPGLNLYVQGIDVTNIGNDITADTNLSITSYFDNDIIIVDIPTYVLDFIGQGLFSPPLTITSSAKSFIHGWRSFDMSEETGIDDFQENIKEINDKTFRIVDYFQAPPQGEVPLQFIPWETYEPLYDLSSTPPGIPRIITRDVQNRFRLYPHPYYKMTLKFDYTRLPQILSAYTDVPRGLDDDFVDIIMWRALIFYGEYDEQPSIVQRATKNYKMLQIKVEHKNRQKFHLKPYRLY